MARAVLGGRPTETPEMLESTKKVNQGFTKQAMRGQIDGQKAPERSYSKGPHLRPENSLVAWKAETDEEGNPRSVTVCAVLDLGNENCRHAV